MIVLYSVLIGLLFCAVWGGLTRREEDGRGDTYVVFLAHDFVLGAVVSYLILQELL